MERCAICEREFKDRRGRSGHTLMVHNMAWGDYQKKFVQKGSGEKPDGEKPPEKPEAKPPEKPETKPAEKPEARPPQAKVQLH